MSRGKRRHPLPRRPAREQHERPSREILRNLARTRKKLFQRDSQQLAGAVFALTAKAHSSRRKHQATLPPQTTEHSPDVHESAGQLIDEGSRDARDRAARHSSYRQSAPALGIESPGENASEPCSTLRRAPRARALPAGPHEAKCHKETSPRAAPPAHAIPCS